ncbi:MAG: hypothetical protein JWN88_1579 [Frankiales bacterium]|nr:hypothetical protein [Frankiales bacterium]
MSKAVHDRPSDIATPSTGDTTDLGVPRQLSSADLSDSVLTTRDVLGVPTSEPPGSAAGQAAVAAVGAWQSDKRISAMWCNRSPRNAFMHVTGIGWKRLSPASEASWNAMVMLATQARQTGCRIDYRDEADGLVHEIYLW